MFETSRNLRADTVVVAMLTLDLLYDAFLRGPDKLYVDTMHHMARTLKVHSQHSGYISRVRKCSTLGYNELQPCD